MSVANLIGQLISCVDFHFLNGPTKPHWNLISFSISAIKFFICIMMSIVMDVVPLSLCIIIIIVSVSVNQSKNGTELLQLLGYSLVRHKVLL